MEARAVTARLKAIPLTCKGNKRMSKKAIILKNLFGQCQHNLSIWMSSHLPK